MACKDCRHWDRDHALVNNKTDYRTGEVRPYGYHAASRARCNIAVDSVMVGPAALIGLKMRPNDGDDCQRFEEVAK